MDCWIILLDLSQLDWKLLFPLAERNQLAHIVSFLLGDIWHQSCTDIQQPQCLTFKQPLTVPALFVEFKMTEHCLIISWTYFHVYFFSRTSLKLLTWWRQPLGSCNPYLPQTPSMSQHSPPLHSSKPSCLLPLWPLFCTILPSLCSHSLPPKVK